jgi:tRNA dimethylallyltransferase
LALRQRLQEEAQERGVAALHARLAELDPSTAARVHSNDQRRIIRALEFIEVTGQAISKLQVEHQHSAPADTLVFAVERPRPELHERIHRRVRDMFEHGLVEEVRGLWSAPRPLSAVAAQGVGYREVIEMLERKLGQAEAMERICARTRQMAKRQGTWFRGLSEVRAWPILPGEAPAHVADRLAGATRAHQARFGMG